MQPDSESQYRPLLELDPPRFVDRIDTPWSEAPDLPEYNDIAFRRIVRSLRQIQIQSETAKENTPSRGILILGEAGTGKTHLLMRVANNLSGTNHILFVRKPNNEEAVAQHIWANVVNSLTRTIPSSGTQRSQLDDLLAHVFSKVLVREFEEDVREGKDVDQRLRWLDYLKANPFNLFSMLGEGERRQDNMRAIRRRTLRFLQLHHPDVDQRIAHVLITYCFVSREDRKRMLLTWLSGQDIDESDADLLGLPNSWVDVEEGATNVSLQQQREEQALRAIRTVGILSTHYQPLILAFDQLEGLRDEPRLTERWGDVIREIFTMTPNMLVVTCIFPSLWKTWFLPALDRSVIERIAQNQVELEAFQPHHGLRMLQTHLEESFVKHRLPTNIYPFTELDVEAICRQSTSARTFVQNARAAFEQWLDQATGLERLQQFTQRDVVTQEAIDNLLGRRLTDFTNQQRLAYQQEIPIEEDFFGRIRNIVRVLVGSSNANCKLDRAQLGTRVMPPNLLLRPASGKSLCIAVMHRTGNAFAARLKNLRTLLEQRQFDGLVIIRDRRCSPLGPGCRRHVDELQDAQIPYIHADMDEASLINAIYDVLVAIEEHDVVVGDREVTKEQFVHYLWSQQVTRKSQFLREAARRCEAIEPDTPSTLELPEPAATSTVAKLVAQETKRAVQPSELAKSTNYLDKNDFRAAQIRLQERLADSLGELRIERPTASGHEPSTVKPVPPATTGAGASAAPSRISPNSSSTPTPTTGTFRPSARSAKSPDISSSPAAHPHVDIIVGDVDLDSPHVATLGTLTNDRRRLGISLTKPQCLAILGYMGSGKSYALGVLIENALLQVPNLISHTRPLSVVAFNYRRNPESRFEYGGFAVPNSNADETAQLQSEYGAIPQGIDRVNVFAFEPELARRQHDYAGLTRYPLQFLSEELGADHWEILMKPPTAQAEYMDVVRDVIQRLFYENRLTYRNLEHAILTDERVSESQRRRAQNRLSFAERWICDERPYQWSDVLGEGTLNIIDLRMQTLESAEALKLCLIVTDLVRRTKNGVNKVIVFDEAHEYVDSKVLVDELENAVTQIRHDGLSFILASQYPDRIPERIFKYLLTRLIFKLPHAKGVNYLRKVAANLEYLSAAQLSNLDLEKGICFLQTDDDCSDTQLRRPQLVRIRSRCSQHGGATIRQTDREAPHHEEPQADSYVDREPDDPVENDTEISPPSEPPNGPDDDDQKTLAELNDEFNISWNRFLKILGLPLNADITPAMTLGEARQRASRS